MSFFYPPFSTPFHCHAAIAHASDYCAIPLILIYINTSSGIKLHFTARLFWQGVYDIGFTTWIFL
ncbi:TPA: hypothetical protein MHR86_17900 [Klebsiella variicola]|nr:hypothetical protein [Klebsiella variicola]